MAVLFHQPLLNAAIPFEGEIYNFPHRDFMQTARFLHQNPKFAPYTSFSHEELTMGGERVGVELHHGTFWRKLQEDLPDGSAPWFQIISTDGTTTDGKKSREVNFVVFKLLDFEANC